jgi:metal-responsive CopG/Arc/MetJ family transcriptional regulator
MNISLSLDDESLVQLDHEAQKTGESRSDIICLALERELQRRDDARLVREHREAYQRQPLTEEERDCAAVLEAAAMELLENEP